MMLKNYLVEKYQSQEKGSDFYTSSGLQVFYKEPFYNENVDLEQVIANFESKVPSHLCTEVEMIIVGHFEEFDERSINAFYKDGAIYISNVQDNNEDILDDILHETSHSIESAYGMLIYGDEKIKNEFLRKREYLHDIMWKKGYKIPVSVFMDVEYNKEFDMLLYQKVGYDKLASIMNGVFINAYAATSLREYFATAFTDFYLNSDHSYLRKVSPAVYEKLILLHQEEDLDNVY
ncbi:MAG TPA: hypothetical protein VLB82_05390 [Thermodesulfobacteriota bacterium]|jgi:hypothetical protein|nr:hypothetical protein [Thermodesulfobacteriota bacterium]